MEVRYADLDFEFQNLMGGGVVGSTINVIINVLGEEIVKTQKHQIIDALRNGFHSVLTQLFWAKINVLFSLLVYFVQRNWVKPYTDKNIFDNSY